MRELQSVESEDYGGKALELGRALRAGLPVPGSANVWIVVMTSFSPSHAVFDDWTCLPRPIITVFFVSDPSSA